MAAVRVVDGVPRRTRPPALFADVFFTVGRLLRKRGRSLKSGLRTDRFGRGSRTHNASRSASKSRVTVQATVRGRGQAHAVRYPKSMLVD